MGVEGFENRLRKNDRHLRKWATREDTNAFRVYDRDIPEYPFVVERFAGRVHWVEYPRARARREGIDAEFREEALRAVERALEVSRDQIFLKAHLPSSKREEPTEARRSRGERFQIREQGLLFWVNLTDYLDTGLFLDHRNTRARIREEASGQRFLNLFAYTGSFTVYAAKGGAQRTTTVDLSKTYLDWAQDNLVLNGVSSPRNQLVRADVLAWLDSESADNPGAYDLIVLDPPSFSTSKNMARGFDVQRDHVPLLERTFSLLAPGGTLYFSTNYTSFQLHDHRLQGMACEELTPRSIPPDFHVRTVHRCWRIIAA